MATRDRVVSEDVRRSINERFSKVIDFYRDTGLKAWVNKNDFYKAMSGDVTSLRIATCITGSWQRLNRVYMDEKDFNEILEYGVAMVKRQTRVLLTPDEVLDNLNKIHRNIRLSS